jgi:hypothetical protein
VGTDGLLNHTGRFGRAKSVPFLNIVGPGTSNTSCFTFTLHEHVNSHGPDGGSMQHVADSPRSISHDRMKFEAAE